MFPQQKLGKELAMSGYYTSYGYMGLVDGAYIEFATEDEYYEYVTGG